MASRPWSIISLQRLADLRRPWPALVISTPDDQSIQRLPQRSLTVKSSALCQTIGRLAHIERGSDCCSSSKIGSDSGTGSLGPDRAVLGLDLRHLDGRQIVRQPWTAVSLLHCASRSSTCGGRSVRRCCAISPSLQDRQPGRLDDQFVDAAVGRAWR